MVPRRVFPIFFLIFSTSLLHTHLQNPFKKDPTFVQFYSIYQPILQHIFWKISSVSSKITVSRIPSEFVTQDIVCNSLFKSRFVAPCIAALFIACFGALLECLTCDSLFKVKLIFHDFQVLTLITVIKYKKPLVGNFRFLGFAKKMAGEKRRISTNADMCTLHKEWDEISCPICMDHPHNAVLLLCSSHKKGCRSYICDTSYRHSNCLDRFKKLKAHLSNSPSSLALNPSHGSDTNLASRVRTDLSELHENPNLYERNTVTSAGLPRGPGETNIQDPDRHLEAQGEGNLEPGDSESSWERIDPEEFNAENTSESKLNLKCPLCRGAVIGLEVVEEARKYLNLKRRSCSRESCSFIGNYRELRRHARGVHPTIRPADIDPSRERAWRHLEHQREYDDIVSAVRSAMPGAVVFGDYVIENGDRQPGERESGTGEVNGPWWSTFFLFQMIGSIDSVSALRGRSRPWPRHRRLAGASSGRRFLWGENLLGLQEDEDDDDDDDDNDLNIFSDGGEDASPIPRRRRRLTRSRSDDDQS